MWSQTRASSANLPLTLALTLRPPVARVLKPSVVVSGRSPISHDLDLQSSVCGSVVVFVFCATSLRLPPHPNRVQRNGQPLCSGSL